MKPALGESLGIPPDMVMIWFGALVAVVLQTAFLSPPVAMSAYYLRQVVKSWSLANIYHGMFQFMFLQVIAIAMIVTFPGIATWFPERLHTQARAVVVEDVEDGASLEDYHKEGSYADQLRRAIEGTSEAEAEVEKELEEKEPEGEEDEKKADDLEKGDASKSK